MKFSVPKPAKPSRHSLYITLAVVVAGAIFAYSVVKFEQHQKLVKAQQAQAAAVEVAKDKKIASADKVQAAVQAQLAASQKSKATICNYIATLPRAKAVAVPADCKQ